MEREEMLELFCYIMVKRNIKPLLSSLKEKKRYLVYEFISSKILRFEDVKSSISDSFLGLFGRTGIAEAGLIFMDDWKERKGIVRVNNKYVDHLKASLVNVRKINKEDVILRSVGVSGVLKQARNKYIGG